MDIDRLDILVAVAAVEDTFPAYWAAAVHTS